MLSHAHALLTIKKAPDTSERRITGIATTPALDRAGDVIDPLGATFTNPLPLLWHHNKEHPIGIVRLHAPTKDGITFDATIPVIAEPGPLRDRTEEAWQSLSAGLITGVSVGYRVLEGGLKLLANGARHFSRTELCELSLVTVPANMQATAWIVKSLDLPYLAASGDGVSGVSDSRVVSAHKGAPLMTAQEQLTNFQNSRAAKVAQMSAIMATAQDATLPEDKKQTYDELALDVKSLDEHIGRAMELDRLQSASATRVPATASVVRPSVVSVKSNLPPGTGFTRAAMAILATKSKYEAIEYAKRWERESPEVVDFLKAAVAPGNTTDPAWAGALVNVQNITSEFIALLRPATILGKIPGLRKVPFNASVPVQTAGGSYGWVGQANPKPVTALGFSSARLEVSKAAGIVVLTEELVRLSDPSAEQIVRADMIAGIAQFLDQQFIDPAVAYVANVHPASITNGITGTASTQNPYEDMLVLLQKFAAANVPLNGATMIVSETNALAMAFLRESTGARVFPNVTVNGGSAEGITIVTSTQAGTNVILLHPSAILYADDGGVSIDVSREASVQMDSAPTAPDATTVLVSLWQNNLVGLRAERFINWKRAVDAGVALITGAQYPAVGTPVAARA
jgi:HK97 family phage major capsid protein